MTFGLMAQNNIQLQINHLLGDADFEMGMAAKNNIDNDFNVTRLEYYISEISLVHDGGLITNLNNTSILVNANDPVVVDLGVFDITNVEKIRFYIGVPQSINHDDPALYPAGHPLAPQFPSMHWGWASGYRFIAMEGYGGSDFNQRYELHGLGDSNYYQNRISSTATATNGLILLNLDADYTRLLEDIEVNNGTIEHGETGDARKALFNFRDFVFSEASATTSTETPIAIVDVMVSPNPSSGMVSIEFNDGKEAYYDLRLLTTLGQEVVYLPSVDMSNNVYLEIKNEGWYVLQILDKGNVVGFQKILVQ